MATIKSYTDIFQSKKLAEILSHESADMWWSRCTITDFGGVLKVSYSVEPCNISQFRNTKEDIPCWSLAALLNIIPYPTLVEKRLSGWRCASNNRERKVYLVGEADNNPINVCYKMILRLHELNLL